MTDRPRRVFHRVSVRVIVLSAAVLLVGGGETMRGAGPTNPTLRDAASADFAAGTGVGTYVAQTADGELILAPTVGSEFTGATIPAGWIAVPWGPNGTTYHDAGTIVVDGARLATCVTDNAGACVPGETTTSTPSAVFTAPHSLEFSAIFTGDRFQHVGFGVTFDVLGAAPPWAIFSTYNGGGLFARTDAGAATQVTDLGSGLLGAFHRYRIDWKAASVDYYIDGALVVTHALTIGGPMRPIAGSDLDTFGGAISVDWMRMSPYAAAGTFRSRVFDAAAVVNWRTIQWTNNTPPGTGVAISLRTGNTPTPDGSWSAFVPVAAPGPLNLTSQFIQYQAVLTSNDPARTPSLEDVTISAGIPPVAVADAANVTANGNLRFPASGPGSLTANDTGDPLSALHVVAVGSPAQGTAVLNSDGSVTYTPAFGFVGDDQFTYTVSDGILTSTALVVTHVLVSGAPVIVPNTVGQTEAAARGAIAAAGLIVGTVATAFSATIPTGSVISQAPVAGSALVTGSSVDLVLSAGPAPVRVPYVVGLTQAAATNVIIARGLVVGTVATGLSRTVPVGSVMDEAPANGTLVGAGSSVNLVIAGVWPLASLRPIADLDGDRKADLTVYRPASGEWFNRRSFTQYQQFSTFQWGLPGDIPVSNDYDGDGTTDLAVFRPANGTWYIRPSSTGFTIALPPYQWGLPGDVPVPGDFDGDGKADLAVFRPANGTWYIRQSITGFTTSWPPYQWGLPGDVPVPGDYDGDGIADLAVWRPASGEWYIRLSTSGFASAFAYQWGLNGDISVPGDYDGDGKTDLAVFRPANGTWYVRQSSTGFTTTLPNYQWGLPGDIPVPGDYDGDAITDFAVWRPATGVWFVRLSTTGNVSVLQAQWGLPGDIPILNRH